jgi:hypothetical protein
VTQNTCYDIENCTFSWSLRDNHVYGDPKWWVCIGATKKIANDDIKILIEKI